MANPSGLFGKVILRDALKQVDRSILAGALTKGRPPDALANDSMRLVMLLQMVVGVNKAKTTGSRLPQWRLDLCGLLDASAVKLEEIEEDRGDGQLDSEPNLPSSSRAGSGPRRLLKRLSSAPSEPAPNESQQKAARKPRSVDPVCWYSAATETAHKQVGGSKALASCSVDASDPNGFLKFTFPDGETWLSEVPCLDLVVFTRPAASISPTMRRPAGPAKTETHPKVAMRGPPKSSEWKLYHTKVYSDARARYKKRSWRLAAWSTIPLARRSRARSAQLPRLCGRSGTAVFEGRALAWRYARGPMDLWRNCVCREIRWIVN